MRATGTQGQGAALVEVASDGLLIHVRGLSPGIHVPHAWYSNIPMHIELTI